MIFLPFILILWFRFLIIVNVFYVFYHLSSKDLSTLFAVGSTLFILSNWVVTKGEVIGGKLGSTLRLVYIAYGIAQAIFYGMYGVAFFDEVRCCDGYIIVMFRLFNFLVGFSGINLMLYAFLKIRDAIRSLLS